jgi:hypothetical protein
MPNSGVLGGRRSGCRSTVVPEREALAGVGYWNERVPSGRKSEDRTKTRRRRFAG